MRMMTLSKVLGKPFIATLFGACVIFSSADANPPTMTHYDADGCDSIVANEVVTILTYGKDEVRLDSKTLEVMEIDYHTPGFTYDNLTIGQPLPDLIGAPKWASEREGVLYATYMFDGQMVRAEVSNNQIQCITLFNNKLIEQ